MTLLTLVLPWERVGSVEDDCLVPSSERAWEQDHQIAGTHCQAPSTKYSSKGGYGPTQGYGDNDGDRCDQQPSPTCSHGHTDAVHRLNGGRLLSPGEAA